MKPFLDFIRSHPRLLVAFIAGVLITEFMPTVIAHRWITRIIMGWDSAILLYMCLLFGLISKSTPAAIRQLAIIQKHGNNALIWTVSASALFSLGAIVLELGEVKQMIGFPKGIHISLVILTLFLSWSMIQLMFALHYAREYYLGIEECGRGGIEIPGEPEPDYLDFLYVSCVIGTSMQTADVPFTTRSMRRTALAHGILAFFFNTCLVALIINISSGLI
jgi:uncharacterized membrane protein